MFKKYLLAAAIMLLIPTAVSANDAPIVAKSAKPIIPCKISGDWAARACMLIDITIEASAPRSDLVYDRSPAKPILGQVQKLGIIYRIRISDRYFNNQATVVLWSKSNRFLAEFPVAATRDVTFYSISNDGGKSWSGLNTSNKNVSFTLQY